jgi:hypothetical protein
MSRLHDHSHTHHTRLDSSRQVISPTQVPIYLTTYDAQRIHPRAGGIRTRYLNMRAAAEPRAATRIGITLIQSQCPQFSQWSLSKWCAHQDTTRIYFLIKATRPAHRDMFVLIPLSVLFKDNVNSCGHLASEADEWKSVCNTGDMTTRENRVPLPLWPP